MGSNKNGRVNKLCVECGKEYTARFSQRDRTKYCSKVCQAKNFKERYKGKNNPNYNKNINRDYDGYKLTYKDGRQPLHKSVTLEVLNLSEIPKGFHIHHRDCNINNNLPENLCVLSTSDHRWLHKQFGNATLWAYCTNKISLEELCSWSTDPDKANNLLPLNLYLQIGIIKDCELLETP